ncbi:uroporphyrinogen-III synthase [Buchnera aphidicola]|nr:uroporphyrinogen-III synthase [Buchnera aphidicola]
MRPSPTGEELVKNLNEIGIDSWHFSLFDFFPSMSSISLSNKINSLYHSNVILIFSKKSIYYTNLYLKKNNLKWPSDAKYYAIGKSTAMFLHKYVKKKLFFLKKKIVKIYSKFCIKMF